MRLIDADALKEYIGSVRAEFNFFDDDERARYEAHSKAIYLLDLYVNDAPSIDIEPKRGEWIDMGDFEQCSVCKGTRLKEFQSYYGKTTWIKTPYCPNCGADMRKESE